MGATVWFIGSATAAVSLLFVINVSTLIRIYFEIGSIEVKVLQELEQFKVWQLFLLFPLKEGLVSSAKLCRFQNSKKINLRNWCSFRFSKSVALYYGYSLVSRR